MLNTTLRKRPVRLHVAGLHSSSSPPPPSIHCNVRRQKGLALRIESDSPFLLPSCCRCGAGMGPSLLEMLSWLEYALKGIPEAAIGPARASVRMDLLHVCGVYANCSDCGNTRAGDGGGSLSNRLQLLQSLTQSKAHKAKPGREKIWEPSQPGLDRFQNRETRESAPQTVDLEGFFVIVVAF